jgi:hypothetical protein
MKSGMGESAQVKSPFPLADMTDMVYLFSSNKFNSALRIANTG